MESQANVMIEAKGLSKYYGPFVAIEDISFSIPEGQIVAFLGPNGAGKSTTMKILTGYLAPSEGSAALAGLDIQQDRLEASKKLGYLPENGPLYLDMTPMELLKFFGEARGLEGDLLENRIDTVTRQFGLQQVLEKPTGKLSRGYRQRVGLAQALMHDPDVLIMDEPTAGLDPNQIRDFRDHIRALGKSKTILISTHILQEVDAVANRVLFVHDGKLIFDGGPEELKEGGSLEEPFYQMTNYGRPLASPASPATGAAPPVSVDKAKDSAEPADENPGGNDVL
jgi:ABC-2 type transport system ATP-binding protein